MLPFTDQCESFDVRFEHPSVHMIVGPPGSGKTTILSKLLHFKNSAIKSGSLVKNIIFCYATWQSEYDSLKNSGSVTKFVNKLPSSDDFLELVAPAENSGGSFFIIDDFMTQLDRDILNIVSVLSRHHQTSVFILNQNLFPTGKHAREISLNTRYMHLLKSPRDKLQLECFFRQVLPRDNKWLHECYQDITAEPFQPFLLDFSQTQKDHLRFRSHYFPNEFPIRVYSKKN